MNQEENWSGNFGGWVKAHPFFALFLFCLVFVVPWGLQSLQRSVARKQVEAVLQGWEQALVATGLPLPGLEPVDVELPGELDVGQRRVLKSVGATERSQALLAWSDLRAGRQPQTLPEGDSELTHLIQACAVLRDAQQAQGDAWIQILQQRVRQISPPRQRLLRLGQALVEGRTAEVLAQAEGIPANGDPLIASTLERVVADVTTLRVRELVAARPATLDVLEELTYYAVRRADGVRAALAQAPAGRWIAVGGGDVERGHALLGLFAALREQGSVSAALWEGARADVLNVVVANWCAWDRGYAEAQRLLLDCFAQDPQARFPLGDVLRDWRPELQRAVNDQAALHRLAVRLFELGLVPPVLEELSSLWVGLEAEAPRTPGEALSAALARVARVESAGGDDGQADAARSALQALEAVVADRPDWIGDVLRVWAGCLRARLDLALGDEAAAAASFRALLVQPQVAIPAFRLRGWLARACLSQDAWEEASGQAALALEASSPLEGLPESYQEHDPRVAEALEASGKPTERGAYGRLRKELLLDGIEADLGHKGTCDAEAWAAVQRLADPDDPRVDLVRAWQAELADRGPQAAAALVRGLGHQPGPWLERRLRAALERVGPR